MIEVTWPSSCKYVVKESNNHRNGNVYELHTCRDSQINLKSSLRTPLSSKYDHT